LLTWSRSWRNVYEEAGRALSYEVSWAGGRGLRVKKNGEEIGTAIPSDTFVMSEFIKGLELTRAAALHQPRMFDNRASDHMMVRSAFRRPDSATHLVRGFRRL